MTVWCGGIWTYLEFSLEKINEPGATCKVVKEVMEIFRFSFPPPYLSISWLLLQCSPFLCWFSGNAVLGQCFLQLSVVFCFFFFPALPRFEVIFEAPIKIYALDETFPLRVCGR